MAAACLRATASLYKSGECKTEALHMLLSRLAQGEHYPVDDMHVQEMTLEEYERMLAEKKAQLNKQREAKAVNATEEFKGMKVSSDACVASRRTEMSEGFCPIFLSPVCRPNFL
eukprot:17438-Pelagomonas_calceolata.AAC.5